MTNHMFILKAMISYESQALHHQTNCDTKDLKNDQDTLVAEYLFVSRSIKVALCSSVHHDIHECGFDNLLTSKSTVTNHIQ